MADGQGCLLTRIEIVPDASWSSVEGSTVLKCPFTVETKYFHAPVEFWLYEGSCPEVFGELGGVADGLVLFFDPADVRKALKWLFTLADTQLGWSEGMGEVHWRSTT